MLEKTYEEYLKGYKSKKGDTKGALTRYAWARYQQLQMEGKVPSKIDVAAGKVGLVPGPLTQQIRKQQAARRSVSDILNKFKGILR